MKAIRSILPYLKGKWNWVFLYTISNFLSVLFSTVSLVMIIPFLNMFFEKDMVSVTMEKLHSFPFETTSSMQRDFLKPNTQTELETITGFIVRAGQQLNIETPTFKIAYEGLLKKQ